MATMQHEANCISIDALLVSVVVAFLWGAAFKTYIDNCLYRLGVRHGYRIAHGDIDNELDEARRVVRDFPTEESE